MGAWTFVDRRIERGAGRGSTRKATRPLYVGRPEAASPATGSATPPRQGAGRRWSTEALDAVA